VTVAGGPAVTRSLQHGSMIVVIDQPSGGLFAEQNRSIEQGAGVAVDQLNAAGGLPGHIRIKLLPQSLDGLSAAAVRSRLRSEAAAALILPCDTDSQLNLAAATSQYGVLMLAPCNPDATAGGRYPTYWPVGMAATEEAAGMTTFMASHGYEDAFVVTAPGSRYVELLTADFRSAAQARNIQLDGSASIATTTTDFSSLARTIKAFRPKPSAIFTALPPPLVNRMAAALLAQGVGATVLGSAAMDAPLTLSSGSKALENATFASYGFPRVNASAAHFAADYRQRYSREPTGSFPGLGFETIRLVEAAVRKAGSAEPSAIQQALAGGLTLHGVALADRTYGPGGDHNPVGEVAISKIAGGSVLPLIAITPSEMATP
jgi:branched-chain amino acid transport system substrate-binding protein